MSATDTLVMGNDLKEIHRMTGFIKRFGERHKLANSDIFAFTLAIEELITNTINYGYPGGGTHEISLVMSIGDKNCRAVLSDGAIPFDPLARPEVDTSLPLEEKPIGGLGIHLVKKMMNHVAYEHRDGLNILTLDREIGRDENTLAAGE